MLRWFALAVVMLLCGPAVAQPAAADAPAGLAGRYAYSETELAAGIELAPDGAFRYGLTVGELDERAQGRWSFDGGRLRLETLPKPRPPEIVPGPARLDRGTKLRITVKLPNGVLFGRLDLVVGFINGEELHESTGTMDHRHPEAVDPAPKTGWTLPARERRAPRWVELGSNRGDADSIPTLRVPIDPARANDLTFVLNPNDIGVVDFASVRVEAVPDGLMVFRGGSDGMLFRRVMDEAPRPPPALATVPALPPAPLLSRPGKACDDLAGMPSDMAVSTPDSSLLDGSGSDRPEMLERVAAACAEAERAEPNEGRYAHRRGLAFYKLRRWAEAAAAFQRAMRLEHPGGYDMMAEGLLFGTMEPAIKQDIPAGMALVEQAVTRWGLPEMKRTLAKILRDATPPQRDEARGRRLLEEGAAAGHLPSVADLAFVLATGRGGSPADPAQARTLFARAVAGGSRYGAGLYADMLRDGNGFPEDHAAARELYLRAATGGSTAAMVEAADMLRAGDGGPADAAGARGWYERAAATGSLNGRRALAEDLIIGDQPDPAQGLALLAATARDGSAAAAYTLGVDLQAGEFGIQRDVPRALFWLHQSDAAGNTGATIYIGRMYAKGWGVMVDRAEARRWFLKAKAAGSPMADLDLQDLDEAERGRKR